MRAHAAAGRAFIPAEAIMLTGYTTTTVGGRTQISQGNPDLKPERSTSIDVGVEWTTRGTRVDLTVFRTEVKDRFISNVVVSSPPPPEPIVLSVSQRTRRAPQRPGVEIDRRFGTRFAVFANTTHYFNRRERLANGQEQDILNVPAHTIRAGIDVDRAPQRPPVGSLRSGRKDNDFSQPGFPDRRLRRLDRGRCYRGMADRTPACASRSP